MLLRGPIPGFAYQKRAEGLELPLKIRSVGDP